MFDSHTDPSMKVMAPGKLILSGEHAVVYGKPALAMAINRYATAHITREHTPRILFDLADLAYNRGFSLSALRKIKERIKGKYQRFIAGEYSVRQVLQKPFELAQFALSVFAESMNVTLPHGFKIHLVSTIPIGCGMGSSAATIVSVMHAVAHYLHMPISSESLYQLALEAEHAQHGHSSGIDLHLAAQGGCLYFEDNRILTRALPTLPLYLVNTGTPQTTTGECVEKAAPLFSGSTLGDDFADITKAMDQALQHQNWQTFYTTVRANHQLLTHIGVVPQAPQNFIRAIEKQNGAAKICGAGTVSGERAGVVLVLIEDKQILKATCAQYGYELLDMQGEVRGVHIVNE